MPFVGLPTHEKSLERLSDKGRVWHCHPTLQSESKDEYVCVSVYVRARALGPGNFALFSKACSGFARVMDMKMD